MKIKSIEQLKQGFIKKEFSPVEITKIFLERIEATKELNAFITVTAEQALKQAKIAEQKYLAGEAYGVLEGIPITYKDNIYTKNIRTTSGSQVEEAFIPTENAPIVTRLQKEGAINLGKVNLHEYAFGITSENPFYGTVRNPWNQEYTAGGSSGGSAAAVAASLCMASIGTDTAGSIRIPAASTGTVGLKPTFGLLDNDHVRQISWTLDHIGPITNHMTDLGFMLEAMSGKQYSDAFSEDIRGVRIGVPKNYFNEQIADHMTKSYTEALHRLEKLGAVLIEIDVPFSESDLSCSMSIGITESSLVHEKTIKESLHLLGPDVKMSLENSHQILAIDYIKALRRKEELFLKFEKLFKDVDIIATPTIPDTAQKIGVRKFEINGVMDSTFHAMVRLPAVFNFTGQPALSIPCGIAPNGLPLGLQFAAAAYNERILLKTGYAYEQAYLSSFYDERERTLASLQTVNQ
ncbi:amidase [Sporosarcina pasteurii]|uniref:Glutamyl-tRNA(Gln) amidotransferase subunit A n=1 Tax=Sporosarcina pasteurii TaxID=1474 RepID=A0A380BP22_SPOPA|nr:amidase [Sporosarcina pasteurii]MDS9470974.1 amidase [Sporosarcina pasteurii]QBQ05374.1 amidase [Sporosarcina pasteurii]SUJ03556.1 Glutamyl-tRNA(Gln) amidotransferase subunit A [Sporosarcina pasteurii]